MSAYNADGEGLKSDLAFVGTCFFDHHTQGDSMLKISLAHRSYLVKNMSSNPSIDIIFVTKFLYELHSKNFNVFLIEKNLCKI